MYTVRVIRRQRCCFPLRESEHRHPELVCPLCAIEQQDPRKLTATYNRAGNIFCHVCKRESKIVTAEGVALIPGDLRSLAVGRLFEKVTELKEALAGAGNLLALVRIDETTQAQDPLSPLTINLDEESEAAGDQPLLPSNPQSGSVSARQILEAIPEPVRRLMEAHRGLSIA